MRRKGFSLLEVLLSMAILATMMALTLANGRQASQSSQPHALAEVLAGEFRQAHQKALADHSPVAVVVPSQGNSRPHATSVYLMVGEDKPRTTRIVNFHREYPDAVVSVVHWPLVSGATTLDPLSADFDVSAWAGPGFSDYAFVYDASGRLHTNMLPNFDGQYHVVVSAGLDYQMANPPSAQTPPLNHYALSSVYQPYTLSLSPSGGVQVVRGLLAASSAVQQVNGRGNSSAPAAAAVIPSASHQAPSVTALDFWPKLTTGISSGATALVDKSGMLTLSVKAQAPDGGPLFCYWTATGGAFSYTGKQRMVWSLAEQSWTSIWEWRPPQDGLPGTKYQLLCHVVDTVGLEVALADPKLDKVEPVSSGKIAFNQSTGGVKTVMRNGALVGTFGSGSYQWLSVSSDGTKALWRAFVGGQCVAAVCNTDGTSPTYLSISGNPQNLSWSPDGSQILYWDLGSKMAVSVCDADGTHIRALTPSNGNYSVSEEPHWANRGDRILVYTNNTPYLVNPDGSGLETLQGVPSGAYGFDFSPDNTQMVYRTNTGISVANLSDLPADGVPPVLSGAVEIVTDTIAGYPRWSQGGDTIAYYSQSASGGVRLVSPAGGAAISLGETAQSNYSSPSWCR